MTVDVRDGIDVHDGATTVRCASSHAIATAEVGIDSPAIRSIARSARAATAHCRGQLRAAHRPGDPHATGAHREVAVLERLRRRDRDALGAGDQFQVAVELALTQHRRHWSTVSRG